MLTLKSESLTFEELERSGDIEKANCVLKNFKNKKTDEEIFYHLCFVVLIPQAKWSSVREIVEILKEKDFYNKSIKIEELIEIVKKSRFKNRKAKFLIMLKVMKITGNWNFLLNNLSSDSKSEDKRLVILDLVSGLGMKTASHFLRNMGIEDLAIIDTHIVKFLNKKSGPKSKKEYLEMEKEFKNLAKSLDIPVATLDAIVWKRYSGTEWTVFDY